MNLIKKAFIGLIVSSIEKYFGKYTDKMKVEVNDEGEAGFTINIKVFDTLDSVIKKAGSTLSGLIIKK